MTTAAVVPDEAENQTEADYEEVDVLILVLEVHCLLSRGSSHLKRSNEHSSLDSEQFVSRVRSCANPYMPCAAYLRRLPRPGKLQTNNVPLQILAFLVVYQGLASANRLAVLVCNEKGVQCAYEDLSTVGESRAPHEPADAAQAVCSAFRDTCSGDFLTSLCPHAADPISTMAQYGPSYPTVASSDQLRGC